MIRLGARTHSPRPTLPGHSCNGCRCVHVYLRGPLTTGSVTPATRSQSEDLSSSSVRGRSPPCVSWGPRRHSPDAFGRDFVLNLRGKSNGPCEVMNFVSRSSSSMFSPQEKFFDIPLKQECELINEVMEGIESSCTCHSNTS